MEDIEQRKFFEAALKSVNDQGLLVLCQCTLKVSQLIENNSNSMKVKLLSNLMQGTMAKLQVKVSFMKSRLFERD